MPIDFAHLHCHTVYSIQDAMPNVKDYVNDPILSLNAKGLLTQLIELEDG